MKITLVSMPWQLLDLPSLALGILHNRVAQVRPADDIIQVQGALAWADFLLARSDGELTPDDYAHVAETGLHHGLGDWVFAGALYDDPDWRSAELAAYAKTQGLDTRVAERMRMYADKFVDEVTTSLVADRPDVVGFTTTFMQNMPSLAVARRLKQRLPDAAIVMGGANCDGDMGRALHRNHRFVDYAVRGEGEVAFPELLNCIEEGHAPDHVPGVCWWDGENSVANPEPKGPIAPTLIPPPEFTPWQRDLEASACRHWLEPKLVMEGGRGCWWGEKHQCTFCGLNGSSIGFRSKPAKQLWQEMEQLIEKHRILDVVMVDNIIDMRYIDELLPRMTASGWDLRVHYEVKSNLRQEQIRAFADAGIVHVQPGIESLNRKVLGLMDKGVSGWRNVQLMRDCETYGLTVSWNYLYGFPGELDADYLPVIEQMPALVHLQPPGGASRIALERFSPNFDRLELGFADRQPSVIYDHVYDLSRPELADLVYLFDTPAQGIGGSVENLLLDSIEAWQRDYPASTLHIVEDTPERLVIRDARRGRPRLEHVLGDWQAVGYRLLNRGRNAAALARALAGEGRTVSAQTVTDWLARLRQDGLVFQDQTEYVALATADLPIRVAGMSESEVPV
ncbi:RiPP maturation radical SAM C-methyltransferase [Streptomyces eurythermus]|uniref:RiPP maturation radical SAM C-methyltransferase n=1 Tax=Streptomyces eurythermus TaxID=42237 RepID=UPI0033E8C1A0